MSQSLQSTLLREMSGIKDLYVHAENGEEKKRLIRQALAKACSGFEGVILENCTAIVNYHLSDEALDIDTLIAFLQRNQVIDHYTVQREDDEQFDRQHGTVTSQILSQYELPEAVSTERFHSSNRYHPSPVSSVRMALHLLGRYDVDYKEYTFIDVGSGMGRNLLLASEYPFAKIIGIEHSGYLDEIARRNINVFRSDDQKCKFFDLQCIDALEFSFPWMNQVLYFWRPFSSEIADSFIGKLTEFAKKSAFRIVLVVLGQVYPAMESSTHFRLQGIYSTQDLSFGDKEYFTLSIYSN